MSNNKTQQQDREPYTIELESPIPFPKIADTAYISSMEFCKMTSEIFHDAFADYEGCKFEFTQQGEPFISLIFNHGVYDENSPIPTACSLNQGKNTGSTIIDRTRTRDRQIVNGDRYYLTDDGKDVIKKLLIPRAYNNGNPNWGNIVGEFVENTPMSMYQFGSRKPQFTKVSFIDLKRICGLAFGFRKGDDTIDYGVTVVGPINGMLNRMSSTNNSNYMLNITSVSTKEIQSLYEGLGLGSSTTIIR